MYLETTGSRHSFGRFVRLSDQRWFSLKVVNPDFHISISSKQWRSILCFNGSGKDWYLRATSFKKLIVLDLSKIDFKLGVPGDITDLVFLRYLALASSRQEWELNEDGGFPKLKVVIISRTDLKEWKANVDAPFPKLERLLLKKCLELEEMPDWIEDIATLQLIKLVHCCASLVDSAKQIKEGLDVYGRKLDVLES
nr:putative late blight resistance protein homolog R1B-17 [Ipomoea batatas]